MDWSKDTKEFRSVLLSLGKVVPSDNEEESLYACWCTQKVAVKGCHRYSIMPVQSTDILTKFNEVNLQLQGNDANLINVKSVISTFFSKFNAVLTISSPSWTLTITKS